MQVNNDRVNKENRSIIVINFTMNKIKQLLLDAYNSDAKRWR